MTYFDTETDETITIKLNSHSTVLLLNYDAPDLSPHMELFKNLCLERDLHVLELRTDQVYDYLATGFGNASKTFAVRLAESDSALDFRLAPGTVSQDQQGVITPYYFIPQNKRADEFVLRNWETLRDAVNCVTSPGMALQLC